MRKGLLSQIVRLAENKKHRMRNKTDCSVLSFIRCLGSHIFTDAPPTRYEDIQLSSKSFDCRYCIIRFHGLQ